MAIINGETMTLKDTTISMYLKEKGLQPNRVAVEVNGNILPRSFYESYTIEEEDKIEIVTFVGGG